MLDSSLASSLMVDTSRLASEKMRTYADHLGLDAREIGSVGGQLGNVAQAFTHLSLIQAPLALDHSPYSEAHARAEAVSAGLTRAGG